MSSNVGDLLHHAGEYNADPAISAAAHEADPSAACGTTSTTTPRGARLPALSVCASWCPEPPSRPTRERPPSQARSRRVRQTRRGSELVRSTPRSTTAAAGAAAGSTGPTTAADCAGRSGSLADRGIGRWPTCADRCRSADLGAPRRSRDIAPPRPDGRSLLDRARRPGPRDPPDQGGRS